MDISTGQLIVWIIIGALAGSLVGWLIRGRKKGFGLPVNITLGFFGAIVGGFIFDALNITIGGALTFSLTDLVAAIVGALLLVGLVTLLRR